MNLFLSQPWVQVMVASGAISRVYPLIVDGESVCVGEYQAFGLKKWLLFGAFESQTEQKLTELFSQAARHGVFKVESDFNMSRWQNQPFLASNTTITRTFGTYLVDLTQTESQLWSQMHAKHRNMTRRATQEGVEIQFDLNLNTFFELMVETYAKGGREHGFSLDYLHAIKKNLSDQLLLAGAIHQGVLQAALMVPFDARCGYFLHGASRTHGVPGASNLLHWEAMRWMQSNGIAHYDLGGAREQTDDPRLAGIFNFKKRFGGPFIHCYHWEKIISPLKERVHSSLLWLRN